MIFYYLSLNNLEIRVRDKNRRTNVGKIYFDRI